MTTPLDHAYLASFIERLRAHDWHYEQSDDPRVFKAGQASKLGLLREAGLDPTKTLHGLYHAMSNAYWNNEQPHHVSALLSFDEYAAVVLKRVDPKAAAPSTVQHLAKIVRALAGALARADPDNQAAGRAIGALQRMGLLESTLMTPSVTVPDVAP